MKHYVIIGSENWADEFDVDFFDILTEEEYQKYMIAKEIFGNWLDSYYFGTNEGWDEDFDYLSFTPVEISDEELTCLSRLGLVYNLADDKNETLFAQFGIQIVDDLFTCIEDRRDGEGLEYISLSECSVEEFRAACEELANCYE